MKTFRICRILAILAGMAVICVAAVPPLLCEMYGNVTLGGDPAPAGTVIEARIGEAVHGSLVTGEPGRYGGTDMFDERLVLHAPAELIGRTVTFVVGAILRRRMPSTRPAQSYDSILRPVRHPPSASCRRWRRLPGIPTTTGSSRT